MLPFVKKLPVFAADLVSSPVRVLLVRVPPVVMALYLELPTAACIAVSQKPPNVPRFERNQNPRRSSRSILTQLDLQILLVPCVKHMVTVLTQLYHFIFSREISHPKSYVKCDMS